MTVTINAIREGLNYNSELRMGWRHFTQKGNGVLKEQAVRTRTAFGIKVVGGWNEFQFEEKRFAYS
jgi:hypothetical protein